MNVKLGQVLCPIPSVRVCVLMADPDWSLLAAYRRMLEDEFELVTVSSGLDCVARLRERVPDVLVLEPRLPWGGGDGVLAILQELPQLAMLPVMILTSCRDVSVLKSVAPFRISDYRVKPVTAAELATRIRNVLCYRRLRALIARQTDSVKPASVTPPRVVAGRTMSSAAVGNRFPDIRRQSTLTALPVAASPRLVGG